MQDMSESSENLVAQILDRVKNTARVELVYGEAREVAGKTIIPVAVVGYLFAGGTGAGVDPSGNGAVQKVGSGGGGAGAVRVQPVGVLEITEDDTRLVPIIDWTKIITAGVTFFGLWMLARAIFRRRK